MPQEPYEPINYTTGQPNSSPFVPGSQYTPPASEKSEQSNEEYMKGKMDELVKSRQPKPPADASYKLAHEMRKKQK